MTTVAVALRTVVTLAFPTLLLGLAAGGLSGWVATTLGVPAGCPFVVFGSVAGYANWQFGRRITA